MHLQRNISVHYSSFLHKSQKQKLACNKMRFVRKVATLMGCTLASPEAILTGTGPWLEYRAATATRRWLWLSQAFQDSHPKLTDLIRTCVAQPRMGVE